MAKNVDSLEIARSRLRALRAEKPVTQMGQIRWAWPDIKAALDLGHSLTTVHQRLAEVGIELPYRRLSFYIGRLRREKSESSHRLASAQTSPPIVSECPVPVTAGAPNRSVDENQASDRDPLANLRRLSTSRPGFHWDEAPPDKDKLL